MATDAAVFTLDHLARKPSREYVAEWQAQIDAIQYAAREQARRLSAEGNHAAAAETLAAANHASAALVGLCRTARKITGRVTHAVD